MTGGAATLLIGGSGFLGNSLASAITASGRRVVVAGRQGFQNFGEAAWRSIHQLDAGSIDSIVDLTHAWGQPPEQSRLLAAANLDLATRLNSRRYLFVSSGGAIYGEAEYLPIGEDAPLRPSSDYGLGKRAAEQEIGTRIVRDGLPGIIVRPGNAYGPGHRPDSGQGLVTAAFASALRGSPLTVFGDGGQVRDYIFIDDVAAGLIAALDRGKVGQAYNLGSGVGTSVRQLLDLVQGLAGPIAIDWQPGRASDVSANILDSSLLADDTGWSAQVALPDGLKQTWQSVRDRRPDGHGHAGHGWPP